VLSSLHMLNVPILDLIWASYCLHDDVMYNVHTVIYWIPSCSVSAKIPLPSTDRCHRLVMMMLMT
jgi:hypothetical protein